MSEGREAHTVAAFDEALDQLENTLNRIGTEARTALDRALDALHQRRPDLADAIIREDAVIDRLNFQAQEEAVQLLALRQPLGSDLRATIAALKVSSELERVGDLAAGICRRILAAGNGLGHGMEPPLRMAVRMGRISQEMLAAVLTAYANRDATAAEAVWQRDVEVDDMHGSLFRELLTYMMEDPRTISTASHLIFIAKNIERAGDHASNIAEITHYLVTGSPIPGERPKADHSSYLSPEEMAETLAQEE